MKTYTITQFKRFLLGQDSLGDIHHNLNEHNIDVANDMELRTDDAYGWWDKLSPKEHQQYLDEYGIIDEVRDCDVLYIYEKKHNLHV
jgi:hypothetical protein